MQLFHSYQTLPSNFFSNVSPIVATNASAIIFNKNLATELGLQLQPTEVAEWLSGAVVPPMAKPIAQAYAGHQFGGFNMLGDGRAILLGELLTPTQQLLDIQLKGAGTTPYSRRGDGKMALTSALREYIYSESMHALGIATTRSLAVVATGTPVYRQQVEPGAVLTRIAQSHIRVGTFEYAARFGTPQDVLALLDYTIERHYPLLVNSTNKAADLLMAVIEVQMKLIVQWMRVGFIHGVLNTDNVSIAGQTIDFGPCAFMNTYHPATVYSQIDTQGRYAFGEQPQITHWNLVRFAEALLPLLATEQDQAITIAKSCLEKASSIFEKEYTKMLHAKIGIGATIPQPLPIIGILLQWMQHQKADYNNTFLYLMNKKMPKNDLYESEEWQGIQKMWRVTLQEYGVTEQEAIATMQLQNPNYIPRNTAIEALIADTLQSGSTEPIEQFLQDMQQTYSTIIEKEQLLHFPTENNYSTHCNT